jgi:hypothetical protein
VSSSPCKSIGDMDAMAGLAWASPFSFSFIMVVTSFSNWSIRSWTLCGVLESCVGGVLRTYVQESERPLSTHVLHGCCRSHFSFLRRQREQDTIGLSLRRLGGTTRCGGISVLILGVYRVGIVYGWNFRSSLSQGS